MTLMKSLPAFLCAGACALFALQASAQSYFTDFPEATNSLPTDWVVRTGQTGNPGFHIDSGGDFRYNGTGNALAEYRPNPANGFDALTDYTIETSFRKSPSVGFTGVIGRSQTSGESFYMARLNGDNTMQMYVFNNATPTQLGSDVTTTDDYESGMVWTLRMTFSGSQISAQLFNESDTLVGSIVQNDSTFASGYSGVRGSDPTVWETYSITVPELSISSLMMGSAALLFVTTRRRRN